MLPVTPNFDNAKDFSPLPEGTYLAQAVEVSADRAQSGDGMLKWKLEVIAGPQTGKTIDLTTMWEGKGAGILRSFLEMLNPNYNQGEFDAYKYLNRAFQIEVAHAPGKKDPSRMFAQVKNFKQAPSEASFSNSDARL